MCGTAGKYTAADVFDDMRRMAELRAQVTQQLAGVDMLLVPTALSHWTAAEVRLEGSAP